MTTIQLLRETLKQNIDPKTLESSQNFFKEKIFPYGVAMPKVHKIAKDFYQQIKELPKDEIFMLCEELWISGWFEESIISCDWSYFEAKKFEEKDFEVFEKWISMYVNNWASCDTFCNHTVGEFLEKFPIYIERLKFMATSDNRWMRRAAAVSLIIPARKGMFEKEIFEIADILLLDSDDLVQKGYGWMLKACSQANQNAVFEYVMNRKKVMPRTAFRYAIEKMPKELKSLAMAK